MNSRFSSSNFRPRSFSPWRGWPPPAADFFFGYSATGAGDGGAGCSYRAIASARRRATCARGCLRRVSTLDFELEFSARGPLSLGAVGRRRRRISFSVIRRLALVTAVPAVSYRAIASARRRATCARGCLRRVSTLDFRAGIFGPRSFIPWRGWPPPAADFFFGYSATGAGVGGGARLDRADRERAAARTCARGCLRRVRDSRFSSWNFRPEVLIPWRGWPPPAADFFFGYSATGAGDGGAGCQLPGHRERAAARDLRERVSTACAQLSISSWNFRPEVLYPLARFAAAGGGSSFSVIRRLALVTAVPAVSYRAIASARRRATCARGCLRRVSTLDFRAGIFGPRSFIPWRGWPPPAADFSFRLFGDWRW